ncbi:protein-tyrosine-phosphatase [gamma proteobacterium HTCC2207]|jgi:protein-tyrosine phosphatase|uniref:protein-tyrosine-phosphatase n=1 Tax=gamma proteobacterium HTCC2207 TaxID=314287 RepID=Q1YTT9_9GAMM|nr:protein-tyrosine-phosphatase [gamma proteobacterium HTCC2207]MBT5105250.1 low molecular weight phosphotyrosine protein phosphatase [Porticoccaceae bacterium]MBT6115417.1 low molecular weight phosphotyrosine protein phosphatase [Porticoccaceae bacterium]MBT6593694.1 low molecular weight phosphotyrosine protein phosphatase [Porticoccaceae bacterium]MDG1079653.1 low molecular weight phosphotyrosine protein phosphatase [Porticoccaceae bacterium]
MATTAVKLSVLFVCLGNICRSPTAHGVFATLVDQAGYGDLIQVDSAGTGDWHLDHAPDQRTAQVAASKGYDLSELRARLVTSADFNQFDYIIAMDNANLKDLRAMQPEGYAGHLGLFLDFSEQSAVREVPDPYYGGEDGFELVFGLVEDASKGLLRHIHASHLQGTSYPAPGS